MPRIQRKGKTLPVSAYFKKSVDRDEAIALAHREGKHTLTAIAQELDLSVSRVSRGLAAQERRAKGKACPLTPYPRRVQQKH